MGSESKNGVGLSSPASEWSPETKKLIQSLKEIVNCPESEIYAVLRECNMDPNETVQRLLSQDTFHEVKSKRERRKEMKETQESRPRVNYSSSLTRGTRSASERSSGWNGSSQTSYEEFGNVAHKGENVSVAPSPPLPYLTSHVKGETFNQHPSSFNSDSFTDSRGQSMGTGDFIASTVQHSTACQPAWSGTSSGHLSMADIVRMGRPTGKSSQVSSEASSYIHSDVVVTNSYHHYEKPSQVSASVQAEFHSDLHSQNASDVSGSIYNSEITFGQNSCLDDRPVVEQPTAASGSSTLEASSVPEADMFTKPSNGDESKLSKNSHPHTVEAPEGDFSNGNVRSDIIVTASASSGQESTTNAVGASDCDDSKLDHASNLSDPNFSATLSDDVVATKLEHPTSGEEPENNCAVVLPSHLQILAADCSHLSFGTYKSGNNSAATAPSPSNQSKDDRLEAPTTLEGVSAEPLETRNLGFNGHKTTANARKYDLTAAFTAELMKQDVSEATLGSEYIRESLHDPNVENIEHTTPELSFAGTDPSIGNLSFQSQLARIEATPNDMLISELQSLRESDNLQAQYLAKQPIPSRNSNTSMSFSEDRKPPGAFSVSPPSLVAPNQHHIAPSYSQLNLPVEQQMSMIGYSAPHQNYSQLPSTFEQQAYLSRDDFNRSLADLKYSLPQYGASMSSRLPGASASAGYGSYGMSSNVLANYLQSTQSPMVANGGYDSVFRSQYSNGDNFTSLQQNGSSAAWNVPGSRMMPSAQELAYYSLLGQNQQHAGYRQGQQPRPLQYDGTSGYSNLYRSQPGVARDHQHQQQQQNLGGSNAGDSQDLLSQQLHQLWRQH